MATPKQSRHTQTHTTTLHLWVESSRITDACMGFQGWSIVDWEHSCVIGSFLQVAKQNSVRSFESHLRTKEMARKQVAPCVSHCASRLSRVSDFGKWASWSGICTTNVGRWKKELSKQAFSVLSLFLSAIFLAC